MPGLVGLAIVDSFVTGTPIVTTDLPIHSPEIAYLINGVNGLMTSHNVKEYSDLVVSYFRDFNRLQELRTQCRATAERYTLDAMVNRFSDGIIRCLELG